MSSHFSGLSVVQRAVLHDQLNTQHLREFALKGERASVVYSKDTRGRWWERAAVAAAMLVELTDVMWSLKDPGISHYDWNSAKLLFDTIVKEAKEYGHAPFRTDLQPAPIRSEPVGGVGEVLVAPAQHKEGAESGNIQRSRFGKFDSGPYGKI